MAVKCSTGSKGHHFTKNTSKITVLYTVNSSCEKGRTLAANMKHMKEIPSETRRHSRDTCDLTPNACQILLWSKTAFRFRVWRVTQR